MTAGLHSLPSEVLEVVLSHLPLSELLSSACLVCQTWRDLVMQPRYLAWRKLYFRYKLASDFQAEEEGPVLHLPHPALVVNLQKMNTEQALPWLLRFVDQELSGKQHLFQGIVRHPGYQGAKGSLQLSTGQETGASTSLTSPSFPVVSAWLCLISSSVWDVREVLRVLLAPSSPATGLDVTEFLHLLATFLLLFNRHQAISVPPHLHYNIYHALYLYQHDWAGKTASAAAAKSNKTSVIPVKKAGQMSLMNLGFSKTVPAKVPTAEQLRIIHHPLNLGPDKPDLVKIVAFAGTGKTTTLVRLTEAHPNIKFLLVVYNKSVRIQAESQFPKANVSCKTVHQMAMAKAGFMFSKKLTSNLKAKDILDSGLLMERGDTEGPSYYRRGGQVLATLTNFMNSPDLEMSLEQVPSVWNAGGRETSLTTADRAMVLEDAMTVWGAMSDKEDNRVRMPHDGYLKVWQLRRPSLQRVVEHQVLLLDEGQDMNPAMLDLFMRQNTARVIVGDPHQQIYMFRGAVNALGLVEPSHTYFLTQSFRFGPEIAYVANQCLVLLKNRDERTLVGGKKMDSVLGIGLDKKKQVAHIFRTNIGLFKKLNDLLAESPKTLRIGLVGGIEGYNFQDYLDIYHLMRGNNEQMVKYKNFKSFSQFKAFATNVNDVELLSKVKIVEKFGDQLPGLLTKVKDKVSKDIKMATVVLSTAHKAKGLEFDTVILAEDFPDFIDLRHTFGKIPEDEKNLLYVSITRAKTNLVMNDCLWEVLLLNDSDYQFNLPFSHPIIYQPNPRYALCRNMDKPDGPTLDCEKEMSDSLVPGQLAWFSKELEFSSKVMRERGVLCGQCASSVSPAFKSFLLINKGKKRKRDS